jgi:Domain of unknown function (DUF4112)
MAENRSLPRVTARPTPSHDRPLWAFPASGEPPLAFLDRLSFLMDRLFEVPGTRLRFGLNAILLLLPVLGDVIPTAVSLLILIVGLKHYRVPRIVATRMILNSCLDAALGWIPIVGDLFDVFFKADTRNVRLLQEYSGQTAVPPRPLWRHWVFVGVVLLFFAAVIVLIILGIIALQRAIHRMFWPLSAG